MIITYEIDQAYNIGKHIMGVISTCNLIREAKEIELMDIDKGWKCYCPRTFLIGFPIKVGYLISVCDPKVLSITLARGSETSDRCLNGGLVIGSF
jgi:hypothetical protein